MTSHARPILLVLAFILGGCTDTGQTATTPYTAQQIREANPPGTRLVFRIEQEGNPVVLQVMEFVTADATHAVTEGHMLSEQGVAIGDVERSEATWTEFRDHAAFPSSQTSRTRSTVTVPTGRFDAWIYTVRSDDDQPPTTSRFTFAMDRPGPPVLFETEQDGRVTMRMVLVEDSR